MRLFGNLGKLSNVIGHGLSHKIIELASLEGKKNIREGGGLRKRAPRQGTMSYSGVRIVDRTYRTSEVEGISGRKGGRGVLQIGNLY